MSKSFAKVFNVYQEVRTDTLTSLEITIYWESRKYADDLIGNDIGVHTLFSSKRAVIFCTNDVAK